MNKFFYSALAASAAVAGLTACSSDEIPAPVENGADLITIHVKTTVNVPQDGTRASLNEYEDGAVGSLSFAWEENDRVYFTYTGADGRCVNAGYLHATEVHEQTNVATFEGDLTLPRDKATECRAHYLGKGYELEEPDRELALDFSAGVADETPNLENLSRFDVLGSDETITVTPYGDNNFVEDFTLSHKLAFGHFNVKLPSDDVRPMIVSVSGLPAAGNYQLADATVKINEGVTGPMIFHPEQWMLNEDGSFDFYIPMHAQQAADLTINVIDTNNCEWSAKLMKDGNPVTFDIEPGYFYNQGYLQGLTPTLTAEKVGVLYVYSIDFDQNKWVINSVLTKHIPTGAESVGMKLPATPDLGPAVIVDGWRNTAGKTDQTLYYPSEGNYTFNVANGLKQQAFVNYTRRRVELKTTYKADGYFVEEDFTETRSYLMGLDGTTTFLIFPRAYGENEEIRFLGWRIDGTDYLLADHLVGDGLFQIQFSVSDYTDKWEKEFYAIYQYKHTLQYDWSSALMGSEFSHGNGLPEATVGDYVDDELLSVRINPAGKKIECGKNGKKLSFLGWSTKSDAFGKEDVMYTDGQQVKIKPGVTTLYPVFGNYGTGSVGGSTGVNPLD